MTRLVIGYVPLVDAAVLVAAVARGLTAEEGLDVTLAREASWATIRDKLVFGLHDAAHMLGPLAVATSLGLGHVALPLVAPFALNLGGSAVTISNALAARLGTNATSRDAFAAAARALGEEAGRRARAGEPALVLGTVFPFSTHTYLLRRLLAAAGLEPDRDVRLVVLPPPFAVDALRRGQVDGVCVGSPWNSVAVDEGVGTILVLGSDIAPRAPEKVLALPADQADAPHVAALVRALARAATWCAEADNRDELVALLAAPDVLDVSPDVVRRVLDARLLVDAGGTVRAAPEFLLLGGANVNRPGPDQARFVADAMRAAGHLSAAQHADALAVFRADIHDSALLKT
jgi:NitT/TauT family transport system ATP-binding protein